MKESLSQWLSRRARLRGVLACGVRFPDKTSFTQSWSPEFTAPSLENALRCASDAFQVLKVNFFPNERVRWVYEKALLHCARREDGEWLIPDGFWKLGVTYRNFTRRPAAVSAP